MDWILIIVPFILIIASQAYINNSYKKYQKFNVKSGIKGHEVARKILDMNGLPRVNITNIGGNLTDNYNPRTNTISLSNGVYGGSDIASVAIAAHESCHVIQHKNRYPFMVIRSILVPIVNLTSKMGYIVLIIGLISSYLDVAMVGLILIGISLLFQLVTLPTEYNASRNAREQLVILGIIDKEELPLVRSMLNAAAFTYLASFFASLMQMLRLFLNINKRR